MRDHLNRSGDWLRLKNAGMLAVRDEPGQIMVSRVSPLEKAYGNMMLFVLGFPLGAMVLGMVGGIWGALAGGLTASLVSGILFFCGVIPAKMRLAKFADCVAFTPDAVYFFRKTKLFYKLPREGMQQIVADVEGRLRYHRFIADVGYVCAFPLTDETDQLLTNNILMAAFNQPVWLDDKINIAAPCDFASPEIKGLAAANL